MDVREQHCYAEFLARLGLDRDTRYADAWDDVGERPHLTATLEAMFATRRRDEWAELFQSSHAYVVPVLSPPEAAKHPHNVARGVYEVIDDVLQVAPAPRFSTTVSAKGLRVPPLGAHTKEILASLKLPDETMNELIHLS